MGLVLMLFLLAWITLAFLIFALFFGARPPSWEHLVTTLLFLSTDGIPFLIVGIAVGGVLAVVVFAMTAVAIPAAARPRHRRLERHPHQFRRRPRELARA